MRLPIHDHQLATDFGFPLPLVGRSVANVQRLKVNPLEHPADVRVIIDADHHLALAAPHEVGHSLVVVEGEVDAVAGGLPVRWSM